MWGANFPKEQEPHLLSFKRFLSLDTSQHSLTAIGRKWVHSITRGRTRNDHEREEEPLRPEFIGVGQWCLPTWQFTLRLYRKVHDWLMEAGVVYLCLSWNFKGEAIPPEAILLMEAITIKDVSHRNEGSLSVRTTECIGPSLLAIPPSIANASNAAGC